MDNMDTTSGGPGPSNVQPSLNPSAPGSAVAQSGSGQAQGASGSGPSVVQAVVPSSASQVANLPGAPVANVPGVVVASGADPALSGGASRVPTGPIIMPGQSAVTAATPTIYSAPQFAPQGQVGYMQPNQLPPAQPVQQAPPVQQVPAGQNGQPQMPPTVHGGQGNSGVAPAMPGQYRRKVPQPFLQPVPAFLERRGFRSISGQAVERCLSGNVEMLNCLSRKVTLKIG
jgi:hypothetical protein